MRETALPETAIRRWTRVEYDRLIDLGIFQGERLELLDGWLVLREPQGTRHSSAIRRVLAVLRRTLGETWQIDSQLPIALDDLSEPEPDVSVVPGGPESKESTAARYGWHYRSVETLRPPASVTPLLAPDRSIAVDDLLP